MSTKPKKAQRKAKKHIHVSLPNGAIVKVSPDCPKKTMDALYEMTEAVKRLPKDWGKVNDKVFRNEALDVAIERGERLEKITKTVERLFRGCQCAFCKGSFKNTAALKRILKLAKGS